MKKVLLFVLCTLIFLGSINVCATENTDVEVYNLKISHNMDFTTIPESVIRAADRLVEKYAKEGRKVEINFEKDYQRIDWGEYHNNLLFANKNGDAPDLFHMTNLHGLVEADMLMDLSELADDKFVENIFSTYSIDGVPYGMPFDLPLRVLYFNKSGLKHIGWTDEEIKELPEKIAKGEFTFEEFMETAEKVQAEGGAKFALTHRPGSGPDFLEILRTLGGEYYNEDGKLVFDEEAILRFFEYIYENANIKKITPQDLNQMGWGTINEMVGSGEAFAYYGPLYSCTYVADSVNKTAEELVEDVTFALFPVSEYHDKAFCVAAPQGMGINRNTKYPEICLDLLKELRDESYDFLAEHASKIFTLSSIKEANKLEVITENPVLQNVTYMADYAITPPAVKGLSTFNSELHKQIVVLELGQIEPEEALEEFKTQLELNLDEEDIIFK